MANEQKDLDVVAIVGRPNVGKSALFNCLIKKNLAITHEEPGITRDRVYSSCFYENSAFSLVDTGGILSVPENNIEKNIRRQADFAMEEACLILYVVDFSPVQINMLDHEILRDLRKKNKPIVIVINKVDHESHESMLGHYYELGIQDICPVSALHRRGLSPLFDTIAKYVGPMKKKSSGPDAADNDGIRVAVVGKPNVGKSSLINRILNEERLIVDELPGTTRDAVDVCVRYKNRDFIFIDTAGLRKKRKVSKVSEALCNSRAIRSIKGSEVAVLLIDAYTGITDQDMKILGHMRRSGKGIVLAVNKWDRIEGVSEEAYTELINKKIKQKRTFDVVYMSVLKDRNVHGIFDHIIDLQALFVRKIRTSIVNELLARAVSRLSPPVVHNKRVKFYYVTQTGTYPPVFLIFVNNPGLIASSYSSYLRGYFQKALGYVGVDVVLNFRGRSDKTDKKGRKTRSKKTSGHGRGKHSKSRKKGPASGKHKPRAKRKSKRG